jgi:hypothetical protein
MEVSKMAKRISVISQLRPRIKSQGVADLETLAARMARQSTTFDEDEMFGIFRKAMREIAFALQNGETVKLDGLILLKAQMKVGGAVKLGLRADRSAVAGLNDPALWTADKVINHSNLRKTADELAALWNEEHPDNLVED